MWVFLHDSYLSIVQHDSESRLLQVRARIRGDIERVFPEADVAEDDSADYRFCAALARDRVAHAIALQVQHLNYASLVEEVPEREEDRREAYVSVWARMAEEQTRLYPIEREAPIPAYSFRIDLES
ncbi:MAG: hypothetical protein ACO1SV_18125 [Fimbriimonas sp.]